MRNPGLRPRYGLDWIPAFAGMTKETRKLFMREDQTMSVLRFIGNVLWFVLGGVWMGLLWWLVGVIAFISIVGIPWGRACFVIGGFSFWPFGREPVSRRELSGREDIGTGPFGVVGNVIWLVLAGWWLALGHIFSGALDFITIIGIPFAIQHFKLAVISLWPIGVRVVPSEQAAATRARLYDERK
jgi:uncharacterized membrane protein YccF (DUF307 family)